MRLIQSSATNVCSKTTERLFVNINSSLGNEMAEKAEEEQYNTERKQTVKITTGTGHSNNKPFGLTFKLNPKKHTLELELELC